MGYKKTRQKAKPGCNVEKKRHDRESQESKAWIVGLDVIKIHCINTCMKILRTTISYTCI